MIPDDTGTDRRLDSWKAIAGYLCRDVSTVRRWEQAQGLPVRRVQATKGLSVFAFTSELDVWLKRQDDEPPIATRERAESFEVSASDTVTNGAGGHSRLWSAAAVVALMLLAFIAWRARVPTVLVQQLRLAATPLGVTAITPGGSPLWRYDFPPGETTGLPSVAQRAIAVSNPDSVLVATSMSIRLVDDMTRGGQLLEFSPSGRRGRTFSFEDKPSFATSNFGPPWVVTDFRVQPRGGTWQVAVAAHHLQWWPSLVTVLDSNWRRRATFTHSGWIEMLQWVSPDRLAIAGFSNDRDAGMAALLDAGALDGQAPVDPESPFYCVSCTGAAPLRYLVFPRSEVNRASASPFNRARLQLNGNGITIRTLETPESDIVGPADVLYEFSTSLTLISASYSDRYWEVHRELEAQGKLTHSRATCPDRNGPREIHAWQPSSGWQTIKIGGR